MVNNLDLSKYEDIAFETRHTCMICGENSIDSVIDMPSFPLTEIYVDEKIDQKVGIADQIFQFCSSCGHAQIGNVLDQELLYDSGSSYFFRTAESFTGRESSQAFVDFFNLIVGKKNFKTIAEIGCNDLYLLKLLKKRAENLIGIDPILKGLEGDIPADNIRIEGNFFENVDLETPVDVFICKDTLEHVSNPKRFLEKIVEKATENTLLFFQFPILETLISNCRFDQVFHQHLNYFSIRSFIRLLNVMDCGLIDYTVDYDHWGTGTFVFQKGRDNNKYSGKVWPMTVSTILERYQSFRTDMEETNKRLEYFCHERLYGYGAALMLAVLSYHLKNDLSCLKCIIDDDEKKDGKYYINLPVGISHRSKIDDFSGSVVLLTSISSNTNVKLILSNLFKMNPKYIINPLRIL